VNNIPEGETKAPLGATPGVIKINRRARRARREKISVLKKELCALCALCGECF
jgi:hypothetical protein